MVQVQPEPLPLKSGPIEDKFLEALKSEKIIKAPHERIYEALRYCMLKVGIRSTNLPDKLESMMLYNHLTEYYGKLTVEEIKLAFDLAVTGKIEAPETYENFSCSYLSKVLNAYKVWADKTYHENLPQTQPPISPNSESTISAWRGSVQIALDKFYKGNYEYRLWVSDMYDQLVYDDFIPALYYKDFMDRARKFFCEKTQLEIVQVETKIIHSPRYLSDHKILENKLIEYRNGTRDKEVMLLSKQKAMLKYFEYLKSKNILKIYEQT